MAETEIEIKIAWENSVGYTMTTKEDNGDAATVQDIDENGYIHQLWPHVEGACNEYFNQLMARIGAEMKA